jgi:glycerol-3-phosphate acyltransferase PlsY
VVIVAAGIGGLILFRHRGNIRRLRSGTERRMGTRA